MKDIIEHIKRYRDNVQERVFNTHNNPFSKKGYEGQVAACDNILFWLEDNYQECGHTIRDRQGEPGQEYCRTCVELGLIETT